MRGRGIPPESGGHGAAEETRTPDIQLGKLTLYQLSYGRSESEIVRLRGSRSQRFGLVRGASTGLGSGIRRGRARAAVEFRFRAW